MKTPLVPKQKPQPSRVALAPKITEFSDPLSVINRYAPMGVFNDSPGSLPNNRTVYAILQTAGELYDNRGPNAVKYFYADIYDELFGEGSSEQVSDHQFMKHRVLCYLDILGKVSRNSEVNPNLLNHFIAAWTYDPARLDDLSKLLWNFDQENTNMTAKTVAKANAPKKVKEKSENAILGHARLVDHYNRFLSEFEAKGDKNPLLRPAAKDYYRTPRRDTKIHTGFLMVLKEAKKKNGIYIRDVFPLIQENNCPNMMQIIKMLAEHTDILLLDEETGIISFNTEFVNPPQQEVEEKPKTTPKAKVTSVTKKVAPPTKAEPTKKIIAPKPKVATPAPATAVTAPTKATLAPRKIATPAEAAK